MANEQVPQLLKAIDEADSALKLADAVRALADAVQADGGEGWAEMVPTLIAALDYNNPGAAVAAVDGLIAIGEPAVLPLLKLLESGNYGTRAWTLRALSGIGDPRSLSLLLESAKGDFALSVRRAAAMGLGTIHWEQMEAEQVHESQFRVLKVLVETCKDEEWVVRYAAVAALERLIQAISDSDLKKRACNLMSNTIKHESEVAVQARATLAETRLGI